MQSEVFLRELGQQVRARRQVRGLSQRELASRARLSTRYVSQLESGHGNISIVRLYEVTQALGVPLSELVRFEDRRRVTALVGLRGAGKSEVGTRLARHRACPFVELDALVEEEAGLRLAEIFALHGEEYYRRLERTVLSRFVASGPRAVLATGGSLPTDRTTYDLLKASAVTVWLKARPELHLSRVAEQGDRRPMAGRSDPLAELRDLLKAREPLYAEADVTIDTSELDPDAVAEEVVRSLERV